MYDSKTDAEITKVKDKDVKPKTKSGEQCREN